MTGVFSDKAVDHAIAEPFIYSFFEVPHKKLSVDAAQYFLPALFMEVEPFNRAY